MDSLILAPNCLQAIFRSASEMVPRNTFCDESMITLDTLQVRTNSEMLVTSGNVSNTFRIAAVFRNYA